MELPDDVLQLIREYAKPWFKYHKIYKDTLIMMELESYRELRRCLQYNPDILLPTLGRFEKAYVEYLVALDDFTCDYPYQEYRKRMDLFYCKKSNLCEIQREVYRLIQ
jgi:hypothetical protein